MTDTATPAQPRTAADLLWERLRQAEVLLLRWDQWASGFGAGLPGEWRALRIDTDQLLNGTSDYEPLAIEAQAPPAVASKHDCLMPSACGVTGFYCSNAAGPAVASEDVAAVSQAIDMLDAMVFSGEKHSDPSLLVVRSARAALTRSERAAFATSGNARGGLPTDADIARYRASDAGSVGALDVERLARAIHEVNAGDEDCYDGGQATDTPWHSCDENARRFAVAYDAAGEGEPSQSYGGEHPGLEDREPQP